MTGGLAADFALGDRELVAFVGAGGKSTLMFALGADLAAAGRRVVLTTTTKLGGEQVAGTPNLSWTPESGSVDRALAQPGPVVVLAAHVGDKVAGPPPPAIDRLFADTSADHVLVEADGARGRSIKAPARHEPVIPSATTLVVVVMGIDAVGRPLAVAAHRPERLAELTGRALDDPLRPEDCAAVLGHPDGGLRGVPGGARVAVAVAKVGPGAGLRAAESVRSHLAGHERIERVVLVADRTGRA